jgi:hypothetical protein
MLLIAVSLSGTVAYLLTFGSHTAITLASAEMVPMFAMSRRPVCGCLLAVVSAAKSVMAVKMAMVALTLTLGIGVEVA